MSEKEDKTAKSCAKYLGDLGLDERIVNLVRKEYGGVKLTDGMKRAIENIVEYSKEEPTVAPPHDGEIIRKVLSQIESDDRARERTEVLLDRFGSLMGMLCASRGSLAENGINKTAKTFFMLVTILLWNGKKKITLSSGRESAAYFGKIFVGGESENAVGLLDENYCLIRADEIDGEKICEWAKGAGAKYAIASKRIKTSTPPTDALEKAKDLSKKLGEIGVKLLDSFVFTKNGIGTLGLSPFASELKYTFEYKA